MDRSAHLVLLSDSMEDVQFEVHPEDFCGFCGAKVHHHTDLSRPPQRRIPKRVKLQLWLSYDGSLVASSAVIAALDQAGFKIDYEKIPDSSWWLLQPISLLDVPAESRRSIGPPCVTCGSHDADLLKHPLQLPPLGEAEAVGRSRQVFGEGSDRGPIWVLSPPAGAVLKTKFGIPIVVDPVATTSASSE